jgi:hypothetical protein
MEDRAYMMVYENGKKNYRFAIVTDIPSSKHHEIQEFAKKYHISAMKTKCLFFNTSTASLL